MSVTGVDGARSVLADARDRRTSFLELCKTLVEIETPSDQPDTFPPLFTVFEEQFQELGYRTVCLPGDETGGALYARPHGPIERGTQLILGHADTVHPVGSLKESPFRIDNDQDRVEGPGVFDMKAGLVQLITALEILRDRGLSPPLTPIVLINADEEIGSPESSRHISRLARAAQRTFVLEPALGTEGKIKTARKGIGHYTVTIEGVASHAGLAPEKGSSAILELTHVIQNLNDLNDPERGITVNVGVIEGGTRSNVVASSSRAEVDVRVSTGEQAREMDEAIRSVQAKNSSVQLSVEGGFRRPPMERTDRNRRLWKLVRRVGNQLGLQLDETRSGGGSDGNIASRFSATVDGMGPVGDGAHESYEYINVDETLNRTALLALTLLETGDDSLEDPDHG